MIMRIPAIQGKIGITNYYTANLNFLQVSELIKKIDGELHTSSSLKEQIQRSLTDNYSKIKDYILNKEDHFFNSLVLAIYDGEPKWTEIRYEIDNELYHNVGLLELNGEEKIFPVDGQHRVEGIKAALAIKEELQYETIPVMIIAHSNTPQGMERSRRIFSTLNRYAKPVRLGDIIALDEDDAVAIVTRELLETFDLFKGNRIKATNSKSIPVNDKIAFTSLMTLYSCHIELFKVYTFGHLVSDAKVKERLRSRPEDTDLNDLTEYITDFWNNIIAVFDEVREYLSDNSNNSAEPYRESENGGNIFFRPVALLPFVQACIRIHHAKNETYQNIFNKFLVIDRTISAPIWDKLMWNANTSKMIMRNQMVVKLLLIYIFDEAILTKKEKDTLFDKYALIHNCSVTEAELKLNQYKL